MPLPRIYFEKLLENSPDIVVAVDRQGAIVFYNDGARQTLGYTSEEVLGKPVQLLYRTRDRARDVMRAMRGPDAGPTGTVKNYETVFVAKDGAEIPVAISGAITRDESGAEVGSIGFAKDLRQIRQRDRLVTLGELAVSLAHEINNPLEVITNTMELLEAFVRRTATDEQMVVEVERFEAVQREVAKIHAIVGRVQELAAGDEYETRPYLPGTLMTDLRQTPAAPPVPPTAANGGAPSIAGLRILVVDDDLGVCQSLAELLRHQGCAAVIATSALDALRIATCQRFDLVVSDVVMPDMDGYDLYMELKDRAPRLPVILMTGYLYDHDHVIKRSKLAGLATGVLYKKPIDLERLKRIIHTHCFSKEPHVGERREPGRNPALP
ncbi:MAG: PAS domain S-box protein [Deltaproteobacteria bacterium]|nr:PAS domain S-box protein [Deltaproteobacteria bacterium]